MNIAHIDIARNIAILIIFFIKEDIFKRLCTFPWTSSLTRAFACPFSSNKINLLCRKIDLLQNLFEKKHPRPFAFFQARSQTCKSLSIKNQPEFMTHTSFCQSDLNNFHKSNCPRHKRSKQQKNDNRFHHPISSHKHRKRRKIMHCQYSRTLL